MSPKRGDAVPQPPIDGEWHVKFGTTEAAVSWAELVNKAAGNARRAWDIMRTRPGTDSDDRHHQLKGTLSTGTARGRDLPRWQIATTRGGRIWYLVDEDKHTIWVIYASLQHPKQTE